MAAFSRQAFFAGFAAAAGRAWTAARARPAFWAAAAVVAGAAALRFSFLNYGLPALLFWDEPTIVVAAREMITNNRPWPFSFYNYPSLIIDVQAWVAAASYVHAVARLPNYVPFPELPLPYFFFWGRAVSAAFSVATAVLVYLFAARVWRKPWWGVAAAAFLALSPHHNFESHQIGVDVPLAAFTAAAAYFLFRYRVSAKRRHFWLSAVFMGAACATKYNGVLFLIPALAALAVWRRRGRELLFYALTTGAVFLVFTPGAVARPACFVNALGGLSHLYYAAGEPFRAGASLPLFASFASRNSLGWAPSVLMLAGVVVVIRRWRGDGFLFLLFPLVFVVAVSLGAKWAHRFILDVFPFLVLFAAAGLGGGAELARRGPRLVRLGAPVVLAAAAFIGPARNMYIHVRAWTRDDPRVAAAKWFAANVPWPAVVIKEVWNDLPPGEGGETDAMPLDDRKYAVLRTKWITSATPAAWAEKGAVYYVGHVSPGEYPSWAAGEAGALAGARGDPAGFWRRFRLVRSFPAAGDFPAQYPVRIYRLDDALLARRHPFRASIPLEECRAARERAPYREIPYAQGRFLLNWNARVGCFFTAPEGDYRIGLRLVPRNANGGPPSIRVAVDGETVADFGAPVGGVYWTRPIPTSAIRYRHLLIQYYNDAQNVGTEDRAVSLRGIDIEPAGP